MAVELAVTDAHALIWYALGRPKRLGRRARAVFQAADAGRALIHVPIIALAEIFEAARRGTITLAGGAAVWAEGLFSTGSFVPMDLSLEILIEAERLYSIPERGARLIAATAVFLRAPLLTRDPAIADEGGVEVVW